MGRKTLEKERDLDPEVRKEYLARLVPLFVEKGMSMHSMDAIVQYLEISKATFYRHFHSRDELFELFIDYIVEKILSSRVFLHNKGLAYEERYLMTFAAILHELGGMGFTLMSDLRYNLLPLWEKVRGTYSVWEKELHTFFKEGIESGYVHDVNPSILAHMIILFFRELMTPEYLQSLKMTLAEAFMETFKIQIRSIVKDPNFSFDSLETRMRSTFPELEKLFKTLG
ncbi:MAG: TetR/AcrR family transcriptional regulator [Spirochaetes bacterium]|nr:TetR/AcrR family transcriptional regulator [Spirochaetota bacterium]MBX3721924.1 TetR/AcrR family transcriptional regulator [Turneriella sp.]